jgi:zinc protease
MFEHMMFKGTVRFPNKEFDRILQANGIVNNAFTTQDYTGYYEILPSSKLELIMDMEADRMQSLQIVNDEFMKEREVVKEERRMRYENDPGGMGWEKLNNLVFSGNKYALPVIGTMQEINDFNVEKLTRFYKKWYVPSNAVVAIVGDFDPVQLKKWIKTYYGSIKSPPRPTREVLTLSSELKAQKAQIPFPVKSAEILWGAPTIKSGSDDAFALDLLSVIFGQGKSSHLFTELIYKKQMALSAASSHYSMQESGLFIVQATAKPGVSAESLQKALSDLFERFLKQPIQAEELLKAKNILLSDYLESLKTTDGKARLLTLNEVMLGDYHEFFRDMERYLKVSLEDLQRVKSYLAASKFSQVIVDSGKGGKSR